MALWASSFKLLPFVGDSGFHPSIRCQAVPSCRCALKSSTQFSETEMAKVGRIKLGSQGLDVSAQGLGCMGMTPTYDARKPEPDLISLIHHAIQNGVTFLDTADVFGLYTNEILLGKALKEGFRDEVELGSKFGLWVADGKVGIRGDPEYVRSACEASLKRLEIDCIDLYYVIRIDTRVPIEVTVNGLGRDLWGMGYGNWEGIPIKPRHVNLTYTKTLVLVQDMLFGHLLSSLTSYYDNFCFSS